MGEIGVVTGLANVDDALSNTTFVLILEDEGITKPPSVFAFKWATEAFDDLKAPDRGYAVALLLLTPILLEDPAMDGVGVNGEAK